MKRKWLEYVRKYRVLYYITVAGLSVYCFLRCLAGHTSAQTRRKVVAIACVCILLTTALLHSTVAYMNQPKEKEKEILTVSLSENEVKVKEGYKKQPTLTYQVKNVSDAIVTDVKTDVKNAEVTVTYPEAKPASNGSISIEPDHKLKTVLTLNKGLKAGVYPVTGTIRAKELRKPIQIQVQFVVEGEKPTESPTPTEKPTEKPTQKPTEKPTPTPVTSSAVTTTPSCELTPSETTLPKVVTTPEPKEAEKQDTEKTDLSDRKKEATPQIEETSKTGAVTQGDVCYGMQSMTFGFQVQDAKDVVDSRLYYEVNGVKSHVAIVNDEAEVSLTESMAGWVTFYCLDKDGKRSCELKRFVVLDNKAPEVTMKKVFSADGEERIRVSIRENETTLSGISEVTYQRDDTLIDTTADKAISDDEEKKLSVQGVYDAVQERNFYIPVERDDTEHSYRIQVKDISGNVCEKTIRETSTGRGDIVAVTLPTEFTIHMNPLNPNKNEQICSDLIPIVNHSAFDLDVEISKLKVEVSQDVGETEKKCSLNMTVQKEGNMIKTMGQVEKNPLKDAMFSLDSYQEKSDDIKRSKVEFYKNGIMKQILPTVSTAGGNAAFVQFTGALDEATKMNWRNGDLKVTVVFDFCKKEK